MNTTLRDTISIVCIATILFAVIIYISIPNISEAKLVEGTTVSNNGTAANPSGALSNSGCSSCNTGGLVGTNTGFGVPSPISATLPSGGGGGGGGGNSAYSQGSYGGKYSQGSYGGGGGGGGGNGIGTVWNGSGWEGGGQGGGGNNNYSQGSYYSQAAYAPVGMTLTADPDLIRYPDSATITWSGGNARTCTMSGRGIATSSANLLSGSQLITGLQNQSVYKLTCTLDISKTITTSVKVLPVIQES